MANLKFAPCSVVVTPRRCCCHFLWPNPPQAANTASRSAVLSTAHSPLLKALVQLEEKAAINSSLTEDKDISINRDLNISYAVLQRHQTPFKHPVRKCLFFPSSSQAILLSPSHQSSPCRGARHLLGQRFCSPLGLFSAISLKPDPEGPPSSGLMAGLSLTALLSCLPLLCETRLLSPESFQAQLVAVPWKAQQLFVLIRTQQF